MTWKIKAKKEDRLLLLDYKLKTIIPYINTKEEKLKIILYVNNYIKDNYDKGYIIWHNFKKVGAFIVDGELLDLLYIEEKYRNKGIGSLILKKLNIKNIKVQEKNKEALRFYQNNGFKIKKRNNGIVILGKEDSDEYK